MPFVPCRHSLSRYLAPAVALGVLLAAPSAHAYVVQKTLSGLPVHWPSASVAVEIDPSVIAALPTAADAASAATFAWAPAGAELTVSVASLPGSPAIDGRNVVYLSNGPYAAAGDALAVTLVSYDDTTGEIVDADIILNGRYTFALLPAAARAPADVTPVANEPVTGGTPTVATTNGPFDFEHVLAHETGHLLGLRDSPGDATDVMYLYTLPNDASRRAPTPDDLAGVASLYEGASTAHGCAAAIAPAGPARSANDAQVSFALVVLGALVTLRVRAGVRPGLRAPVGSATEPARHPGDPRP